MRNWLKSRKSRWDRKVASVHRSRSATRNLEWQTHSTIEKSDDMTCHEAAPCVSASCDGERIPRDAATHLHDCSNCCNRLADSLQMSGELKRIASETAPESVPMISWGKRPSHLNLRQFGRKPTRVPRFALALMMVAIAALSAGLFLVRTKEATLWWFDFSMRVPDRGALTDTLKSTELASKPREFVQPMPDGNRAYVIRLVDWKEGAVEIAIRAQKFPLSLDSHAALEQTRNAPE